MGDVRREGATRDGFERRTSGGERRWEENLPGEELNSAICLEVVNG